MGLAQEKLVKGEQVLYNGKPAHVVTVTDHSVMLRIGKSSYKTVLLAEVELIDGGDVEVR
mgnify:CR=1 FL=1